MKIEIPVEADMLYCDKPVIVIAGAQMKEPLGCKLIEHEGRPYLAKGRRNDADFYFVTPALLKQMKEQCIYPMEKRNHDRRSDRDEKR